MDKFTLSTEALRKKRLQRMLKKLTAWVFLPTFLAIVYYGVLATNFFQSKSEFAILSAEKSIMSPLEGILSGVGSDSITRDAYAVQEYILSRDALKRLDEEHHFLDTYRSKKIDFLSRFFSNNTFESAYGYYLKQVNIIYDTASGIMTLTVKAPSPEKAKEFSEALIDYAEELVNGLSDRSRQGQLTFAEEELKEAEDRLTLAKENVLAFQATNKDFNPMQSALSVSAVKDQLDGKLTELRAEFKELSAIMNDDAPKVLSLKRRIESIEEQIAQENERLVNVEEGGLNVNVASFEKVYGEKEFAEKAYKAALGFMELSRVEASKQIRYLTVIVPPMKSDAAAYPRRFVGILTVFFICIAVFGVVSLLIASIKEHARI